MPHPNALHGAVAAAILSLLAGCGDPIGTPCEVTSGTFGAENNCRHNCLFYQSVVCPDGAEIKPKVCSGERQCVAGQCPAGQVCYNYADPYQESVCILATTCGSLSAEALWQWETKAQAVADAARAELAAQRAKRKNAPTAVPAPVDD